MKHQSVPASRRLLYYIGFCLGAALPIRGGILLGKHLNAPLIPLGVKLLVGLGALLLAGKGVVIPLRHRASLPILVLIALTPPCILLAFRLGPASLQPTAGQILLLTGNVLLTGFWEEAVFRLHGRLFLEEEGRYKARDFLIMALFFGALHTGNASNGELMNILFQVAIATLAGLFLQSLYAAGGSLLLIILTHALINASSAFPELWVLPERRFLAKQGGLDIILYALFMSVSAALISRKWQIIKRGKSFFLNLGRK